MEISEYYSSLEQFKAKSKLVYSKISIVLQYNIRARFPRSGGED